MSTINSLYSSSKRVTGLFSGMDTDTLVKQMCSTAQTRVDNKYRDQGKNEWRSEALKTINEAVEEFTNKYTSVLGANSMVKSATYSKYEVTSLNNTNSVKVTAGDGAYEGKYSVSVSQLAGAATASGRQGVSSGTELSASNNTKLSELAFATGLQFDAKDEISFEINGKKFSFNKDTTLQTMINTINNDEDAGVTMKYSRLSDSFTIESDTKGAGGKVTIRNISGNAFGTYSPATAASVTGSRIKLAEGYTFTEDGRISYEVTNSETGEKETVTKSISDMTMQELADATGQELPTNAEGKVYLAVNGRGYNFSADRTVGDVMAKLTEETGVQMSFDEESLSFTVTADDTGADSFVNVSAGFSLFGIAKGEYTEGAADPGLGAFGIANGTYTDGAQDAVATINGVEVRRSSNEFTIDGVTYSLNEVTESTEYFMVDRDFSSTVDAVQEFVNGVNDLLALIEEVTDAEDFSRDYRPLTEAEKAEMSEEQIKLWEDKGKGGILSGDDDLERLLTNIKSVFFSAVGGTGKSLASIGITTGSYYSDDAGRITLDVEKLEAALAKDSDAVVKMFAGGNSKSAANEQGAIYQLRGFLTNYSKINDEEIESLDAKNDEIDKDIATLEERLAALSEKYYNQFAAMETALAQLNSSASMITSLFPSA